ncbi:MAG: hypothetical protein AAGA15_13325 [Pseudomonadota bacterium]
MSAEFDSASDIANSLLQKSGNALLDGSFDAFAPLFTVPTTVETFEGRRVLTTIGEIRTTFQEVCRHYKSQGTTDLVRHVVAAEFVDETTVRATVEVRVISGSQLQQAPYVIFSKYVYEDGAWKIAESIYVLDDAPIYIRALTYGKRAHSTEERQQSSAAD